MKKFYKGLGLIVFILTYMFIPSVADVCDYEINYLYISSVVAESFYEDVSSVSTDEKLLVRDYVIEDDRLYIFPLSNDIKLPIGVMVASKSKDFLEVVSLNDRYYIYNIDETNINLYQYVDNEISLGKTNSYYLIIGDNLGKIINQLEIYYEKV